MLSRFCDVVIVKGAIAIVVGNVVVPGSVVPVQKFPGFWSKTEWTTFTCFWFVYQITEKEKKIFSFFLLKQVHMWSFENIQSLIGACLFFIIYYTMTPSSLDWLIPVFLYTIFVQRSVFSPKLLALRKEERRASKICCPTQRKSTFILVYTVFD